ncbi:MAG: AraC family transcriptional regulator [Verrucomicrobiota bacterium]
MSKKSLELAYCYGGISQYEPGEVLGPRKLTDYEAVLIIEGSPRYETNAGVSLLSPGTIHVARPETTETFYWDDKHRTRHAYLHFDLESIPDDWDSPDSWPRFHLKSSPVMIELFRHILERAVRHSDWPARKPGRGDNRIFEAFLGLYVHGVQHHHGDSAPAFSQPVTRAVQFIRERLDAPHFVPISLDELAAVSHVTQKHLCRVFQQELGVSPIKSCRLMQFQLAIPLLARSNLMIKQIAERCGFPDQLQFSRSFSRTFGYSPSECRKKILSGAAPPRINLPAILMPRLYW